MNTSTRHPHRRRHLRPAVRRLLTVTAAACLAVGGISFALSRSAALPQAVSEAPASGHASGTPRPSRIGGLMAYETDDVDQRPSVVKNARVEYPRKARRLGLSGRVVVQLVVDTEGKPQSCKIRSAEPTGHFEEAALSAARGMRFIPGKIQGRPVNTVVLIPFNFSLR